MELSDEQLYRLMKDGDSDAFAELYRRREPGLYRYALHMTGNQENAEEVTHEVFLRLIGSNAGFDPQRGLLEAYLYGVARNVIRAMRKKRATEQEQDVAVEHDILGGLIRTEITGALYSALKDLPEHYRDAVIFCDLEEHSYEHAARLMNCPVGTVRSRLHRARLLLSAKLKPLHASSEVA